MLVNRLNILRIFILLLFLQSFAFAQSSYSNIKIIGLRDFSNIEDLAKKTNLISFKTRIPGVGTMSFIFDKKKNFNVKPKYIDGNSNIFYKENDIDLFSGHAKIKGIKINAHASIKDEILTVSFSDNKLSKLLVHYFKIEIKKNATNANFRRLTQNSSFFGTCGTKTDYSNRNLNIRSFSNQNLKEVEIGLIADKYWFSDFGFESAEEMLRIASEVDTIYSEQLKIKIKITEQIIYSDKIFGNINGDKILANNMLTQFKDFVNKEGYRSNGDAFHLFSSAKTYTEEDPEANVIGLAYTAVICRAINFSYAYTTRTSTPGSEVPTFAHELAHNFSASHTDSGIMTASLNSSNLQKSFSNFSLLEVNNFIASYNSCLKDISSGSGGSASGENFDSEEIKLKTRIKRNGLVTIKVDLLETFPECSLKIRGGTSKAKISQAPILFITNSIYKNLILKGKNRRRGLTTRTRSNKAIRYFLTAQLTCPDGKSGQSRTIRISPQKIRSRRIQKPKRWFRSLKNRIEIVL